MKNVFLKIGIVIVAIAIILEGFFLIKGKTYKVSNPVATIEIEGYDKPIKIELDPQSAPNAVANFIQLSNRGFYNNYQMTIDSDKLASADSTKKANISNIMDNVSEDEDYVYGVKGDLIANGIKNLIKHQKGVITMKNDYENFSSMGIQIGAYEEIFNTANNEFYILTEDINEYNGVYAAFGKIVEGTDVLDAIAATRVEVEDNNNDIVAQEIDDSDEEKATEEGTEENNETQEAEDSTENDTTNKITIKSIAVDTFGIDYGTPDIVNYEQNLNQLYQHIFSGSY